MNTAILGGAFNPPHLGHLLIAEQTLEFTDVNEVWLTPCYRHTFLKDLAPVTDRVAMTKLLINSSRAIFRHYEDPDVMSGDEVISSKKRLLRFARNDKLKLDSLHNSDSRIQFCDEEIKNKLSGDTIDLMEILGKKYPTDHFSFLIGSDNLPGFKRWGRWQELITCYNFLVYPRPGFTMNLSQHSLDNPNYKFKLINSPLLAKTAISSTTVRERIKKGLLITHVLPKSVEDYIKKHRLYI